MGGRGGSSHRSVAAGKYDKAVQTAATMNIRLNTGSFMRNNIIPRFVEETLESVKAVVTMFPQMKGYVKYIDAEEASGRAYASAGGDGGLHMGLYGRWTQEALDRQYRYDLACSFHPQGTPSSSIFVHEMGHQIEAYMNKRDYNAPWAWGKTADRVVFAAAKAVDPTISDLHSEKAYKLALDISHYAVHDYNASRQTWATWETLAEAVADYHSNGANAKPLSREIAKILIEEMK